MQKTMVGIWMDHKKAVLTICSDEIQKTALVHSRVARWSKATGGSRGALPYGYNGGGAEDKKDHRRDHALHDYFRGLLEKLRAADEIYLMGPGLAKKEFKKFLDENHFGARVMGLSQKDHLTENQIAAETRAFFHLPRLEKVAGNKS